jgi:hypothetical protein
VTGSIVSMAQRLSKVRAMSPRELTHRLQYKAVLIGERRRHRAGRLAPPGRLHAALVSDLRGAGWEERLVTSRQKSGSTRFFAGVTARDRMRSLFATMYKEERAASVHHAELTRGHRFEFFGQQFEYADEIDWQCDPVSGRRWPSLYHAEMPVHGGDVGYGDVKYVWELNRHQFLIDLGKAWYLERNAEDLHALQHLVRSWIAANPYATGVNWACALEPAFRLISWVWAYHFTSEDLDHSFHLEWLGAIHDHGRFIERHLELYSSPYNHLIGEASALYMLGSCFPEFRDAARWRAVARQVLERRLPQQFYADGGSVEQSTFYHHATLGFYLLAAVLARATGDDLSKDVWAAIERGITFSMALTQPDGRTPTIGGADDGKPIRMEHLPLWDFRPFLAIGAVLFDRGDYKYVAGRFHEDALWLLGPAGLARFDAIEPHPPRECATSLAVSGYHVMRSGWATAADYVLFDCGEQAAGMRTDGVPNSMHGHADCLSIVACLEGRSVLVDSGFYAYNCGGEWEAHFRETAAHNTAKIDGRDQARHIRGMAWSHSYRPTLDGWNAEAERAWVIGSHDGYARTAGVVHRRAVWLRPDSYLLICDEFVGTGVHDLTVNYQFAPGSLEHLDDVSALFGGAVEIAWAGSEPWRATAVCGGPAPADGWIAPSLGVRQPAPRLSLECTSRRARTTLLTVIAARVGARRRVSIVDIGQRRGFLALVRGSDYTDHIRAAEIASAYPIETNALLAVCRVRRDGSVAATSIGGSPVVFDAAALRRLESTSDSREPVLST